MKRLNLKQSQIEENKFEYLVVQVVDSPNPKIGERLTETQVNSFCANAQWTVTIK
jgi:hypothetical protein